ncbi:MAG: hypothetical protein Q4A62_10860 [Eikenella sp.]|nr:hypothetical protein [Eikenella sp.]
MQYEIQPTHIGDIKPGDTVMHHGEMRTVGRRNIKRCPLMGLSLFGDSYQLGRVPVEKVIIYRATVGGWVAA